MEIGKKRKQPPIWLALIIFISLFFLISVGITLLFNLPWYFPVPYFWGFVIGIILLAIGFFFLVRALKSLTIKRAFGSDVYKSKTESKLIVTGIYSHTRNPLYLGATILFLGWFFVFLYTFLLIVTLLFLILFVLVAKWEEKELHERFGEEYEKYKESVPFFLPFPKKRSVTK